MVLSFHIFIFYFHLFLLININIKKSIRNIDFPRNFPWIIGKRILVQFINLYEVNYGFAREKYDETKTSFEIKAAVSIK